jgi:ComF family protein
MQFLKDFFYLFYPKSCATCENKLVTNENILCTYCRHDLPLIGYTDYRKNKVTEIFYGRVPIEKGMSFLFFRKKGKGKALIHQLKYKGNEEVGSFIGNWFGEILSESKEFDGVDYIIPVPLHKNKLKKRGYNQVTKFGETLSVILNIPYKEKLLIRASSTKTQTLKQRFDRFKNIDTQFLLTDTCCCKDKHVLLIDDVITTGATLEACSKELLKIKGIKISIATMAFTE